jgi:Core histone H2A/H2B/H3/H4
MRICHVQDKETHDGHAILFYLWRAFYSAGSFVCQHDGPTRAASQKSHRLRFDVQQQRQGTTSFSMGLPSIHDGNIILFFFFPLILRPTPLSKYLFRINNYTQMAKTPSKPASDKAAPTKRASTGGAKGKGKRTKRTESYSSYIHKVLKQVHPNTRISKNSMSIMDSLMKDIFDRVAGQAQGKTRKQRCRCGISTLLSE